MGAGAGPEPWALVAGKKIANMRAAITATTSNETLEIAIPLSMQVSKFWSLCDASLKFLV